MHLYKLYVQSIRYMGIDSKIYQNDYRDKPVQFYRVVVINVRFQRDTQKRRSG